MDQTENTKEIQLNTLPKYIKNSFGKTCIKLKVFTHTWIIENFVHCKNHKNGSFLSSSLFKICDDTYTLGIKAYPTGVDSSTANYLSLYLIQVQKASKDQEKNAYIELSILDNTGKNLKSSNSPNSTLSKDSIWIFSGPTFAKRNDVFNSYLINDNLTIKCTIHIHDEIENQPTSYDEDDEIILATSKMSIIQDLDTLMSTQKFSDVVLVVGNKKFEAHKAILAARSSVFSAMFESPMKESNENIVEIGEMKPEIMNELLRFIYTGQVVNVNDIAADLLVAADMYHLDILRTMCEEALIKTLSLETLADFLKIVDRYSTCCRLRKSVLEFLTCNKKEVVELSNFDQIMEQLSPSLLIEVTKAALKKR